MNPSSKEVLNALARENPVGELRQDRIYSEQDDAGAGNDRQDDPRRPKNTPKNGPLNLPHLLPHPTPKIIFFSFITPQLLNSQIGFL